MKEEIKEFNKLWQEESLTQIRAILRVIAHWMAIPLFSMFWIADLLYIPEYKWEFLAIRALSVPICFTVSYWVSKIDSFQNAQYLAAIYAISLASGINAMIYFIPDAGTGYYAGLNLIAVGGLSFIPFTRNFSTATALGIYAPYYAIVLSKIDNSSELNAIVVNSFFIFSSVCMCFLIRHFHDATRKNEIIAKVALNSELLSREEVIRNKTNEAVRLNSLYSQFSPQIVESIKSGKLKLEAGGQRAQICALFIDIVNSTERVTRIDKDKVEKVLSKFLDDTIKILLKYDITIDKFLGDGILAFCNAPLQREDYIERVVSASLEVKNKIEQEQDFYEKYWQAPLQIRIGIAKGYVNVGFYGSQKYFRSYTAIGPVVNLASRLCTSAEPGQIIVDHDIFETIQHSFKLNFLGKKTLKGFDADIVHTYEVLGSNSSAQNKISGICECPDCGDILSLENDEKGHFVFYCKSCLSVIPVEESAKIEEPAKIDSPANTDKKSPVAS